MFQQHISKRFGEKAISWKGLLLSVALPTLANMSIHTLTQVRILVPHRKCPVPGKLPMGQEEIRDNLGGN